MRRFLARAVAPYLARRASPALAPRLRFPAIRRFSTEPRATEPQATETPENKEETVAAPAATEVPKGATQKREFQAETRQLLDIVARSLYTDREIFIRELISNASDALEKARYLQSTNVEITEPERPFEIHITTDEANRTITIQDSGVGMNATELVENLGTIARSGSKQFVQMLKQDKSASHGADANIIGQFGVGFYSAFMVSDKVEVFSQSARGGQGQYWVSDGTGSYEMGLAEGVHRGTKIIIHLKENSKEFSVRHNVERIIKKYSNFVGFPIHLDGKRINTLGAIWLQDKSSVTPAQYEEFYRYIANAFDKPHMTLHFSTDVPLSINALFYIPETHTEKFGLGHMEPGVNLYCRKVLIQPKSPNILPPWLRFIRGVVDSEDIPLNISRETMQDSALIKKIKNFLTRRVLRFLEEQSKSDPEKYQFFFEEFGFFLKEGLVSDAPNKDNIAKLLLFESSKIEERKYTTLDEYVSRMPMDQSAIYYCVAPSRQLAESSPYFEQFKAKNVEVLFLYQEVDDIAMRALENFGSRKIVSVESSDADLNWKKDSEEKKGDEKKEEDTANPEALIQFLQTTLSSKVSGVVVSKRLVSSPAIIIDHESVAIHRMMQMMEQRSSSTLRKQKMEINPQHPVMRRLASTIQTNPELAAIAAEQIFDNALIAAGLLSDPRSMLARLNTLLEKSMSSPSS